MKIFVFLFLFFAVSTFTVWSETREWTSSDGRKVKGTILGLEGDVMKLETPRGKFELPLSKFSQADQDFAKEWAKKKKAEMAESSSGNQPEKKVAATLGNFEDLKLGEWPQYVTAELAVNQIEKDESKGDEGEYVYRTPNFEFHSPERLSTSVVREFARIFEATFAFVDQMPVGLAPRAHSSGLYQTKLYKSKSDYYSDGGIPGSGGMFTSRGGGVIKVPLPSLGVEYTGVRYIVDHKKRSTTLTHEIVHQVMMRWLFTAMPTWLSEGFAEVVSSQAYNNGRFKLNSMNRAIADEVTRGGGRDFTMINLEKLMNVTHQEWVGDLTGGGASRNYDSASVLAYYFLKLDGEEDGAHLVEYLKALATGNRSEGYKKAQETHLLRGRTYEELEKDVAAAWRSEGLKIEFQ